VLEIQNEGRHLKLNLASLREDWQSMVDLLGKHKANMGHFLVVAREYKIKGFMSAAEGVATAAMDGTVL
jgi:hypothetical protein